LTNPDDSETEDEDEGMPFDMKKAATPPLSGTHRHSLPTPARSTSPDIDPGRAPGRIIGSTFPLADFKKNIAQGDVVTKAVEDLGAVITEIVMRPFSSRRSAELLDCMKTMRDTSLKVRGFVGTTTLLLTTIRRMKLILGTRK
jgi:ATP-dependent DNA helicase 2 subunit 2